MYIDKAGDYVARDGTRIAINTIGNGTFSCKGSIWKMFRGKYSPRGYDIWKPDGSYKAVGEHPLDIVGFYQSV